MRYTWQNHRIMDFLFVAFLLSGCILRTSGEGTKVHSVDVQNVFDNFDNLIKVKSTVPTLSNHACVDSVHELNEIKNVIVYNGVPSDADVSIKFSSHCSQFDKLKTDILKLRNIFVKLMAEPVSSYSYRILKTILESKLLQFKSLLDNTKKVESGERLDIVVSLQNQLQSKQSIFEVLDKLESDQKRLNDANVQVAIGHLQQGKLDEAVSAFTIVTDHETHVERAVMSVYGNGNNFENICRFVARLPLRSRENGYRAIREQLKKDNQLMDRRIWILAAEMHHIQGEEDQTLLKEVMADIKILVRGNHFDGLLEIVTEPGFLEIMKNFAPVLVRTIYEETDGSGVEKFLTMLKRIPYIRLKLHLINELVLMLKSTGRMHGKDMSMIIFELIKLRTLNKPQNKAWLQTVEKNLPVELRDLMYNYLCIQNAATDEYLYAGSPNDENQRPIHMSKTQMNESSLWYIYFSHNGAKVQIKSTKYSEPVYLIDEGNPDDEHVLRTWMFGRPLSNDKTAEFYLDMLGHGEFLIVNKYFGQLLYSPFDDEPNVLNNRPVFSKTYDRNNIEVDSKWIIGVCRVDVDYVF